MPTTPQFVLIPHQVGTEGPHWCDIHDVLADGTIGTIPHSTELCGTRAEAIRAAWMWIEERAAVAA